MGLRRSQSPQHDRCGRQRSRTCPTRSRSRRRSTRNSPRRASWSVRCTASCSASRTCTTPSTCARPRGADADYANDRPPDDATFVKRLRDAGAIILAKANLGRIRLREAAALSAAPMCNPYDTERDAGGSSGGSASSVAANLVTCAIAEEGGPSIRMPSRLNNGVGLVALAGTGQPRRHDRRRPAQRPRRTDLPHRRGRRARPRRHRRLRPGGRADRLQRRPHARRRAMRASASETRLEGLRIGVLREYMDKTLFTEADHETIDIVDRAIDDLRKLGATIVDPGPEGALFQDCIDQYIPHHLNALLSSNSPRCFRPASIRSRACPICTSIRPGCRASSQFAISKRGRARPARASITSTVICAKRGDANIKDLTDLINKSRLLQGHVRPRHPLPRCEVGPGGDQQGA